LARARVAAGGGAAECEVVVEDVGGDVAADEREGDGAGADPEVADPAAAIAGAGVDELAVELARARAQLAVAGDPGQAPLEQRTVEEQAVGPAEVAPAAGERVDLAAAGLVLVVDRAARFGLGGGRRGLVGRLEVDLDAAV